MALPEFPGANNESRVTARSATHAAPAPFEAPRAAPQK